jgi:hypothetical protein
MKNDAASLFIKEAVFDQEFVPNIAGAVLDSAAMLNTLDDALGSGRRIQLRGVTGSMSAEIADAVFRRHFRGQNVCHSHSRKEYRRAMCT